MNFELSKKLRSAGELYEIRQCRDINTGESRAVKIFRKVELTPIAIETIKREVSLLRELDHPNIMKIHQVIEDADRIYLITDDFRGLNLFSHIILKNRLSETETATIAAQLASAVKYLHKQDLVIRRLRPESIVFSDTDSIQELRLTDLLLFNYIEKLEDERPYAIEELFNPPKSSFQGERKFIPEYNHIMSAPELLPPLNPLKNPRRYYDQQVDVWMLGCLIYNMVTGVPAFYDDQFNDKSEVFIKIRDGQWFGNMTHYHENPT